MRKRFFFFLFAFSSINASASFQSHTNSGALVALVVGIIALIIGVVLKAIKSGYNKVDQKVDKIKLERNPDNLKVLEKDFFRKCKTGFSNYKEIVERIYNIDKGNHIPNASLGIHYYKQGNYSKSRPYLEAVYNNIINSQNLTSIARRHFNRPDFDYFRREFVGKAIYYYGHLVSMDGNVENAKKIKKKARQFNRSTHYENLY